MLAQRFAERAEDDPVLRELFAHRRADRHRVEDCVDGNAGQHLLLGERNAELRVRLEQLRIDIVEASERRLRFRRRVVAHALIVDRTVRHVRPVRLLHRLPAAVRLEPPLEHEGRLVLLRRDRAHDVFAQPRRHVSDSMSVTKPCWYSRLIRDSIELLMVQSAPARCWPPGKSFLGKGLGLGHSGGGPGRPPQ